MATPPKKPTPGTRHEATDTSGRAEDIAATQAGTTPAAMDFADVEMAEALADIPQEAKANVFKFDEAEGKWPWVGVVTPSTANHEYFARKFGGGRFRARFRKPGGAWGKQFTIELDPTIRPEPEAALTAPIEGAPRRRNEEDDDFRSLYKMELLDLIRSSRDARTESATSTAAMLKLVMDMVSTSGASTAALIKSISEARPAPAGQSLSTADVLKMVGDARKDALELVNTLRGTGPIGRGGGGNTIEATLEMIERLGEIRQRLDGNGDDAPKKEGGGMFDKLLGDVVPLLLEVLKPALLQGAGSVAPAASPSANGNAPVRQIAPNIVVSAPAPAPEVAAVPAAPPWLAFAKTSMLEAAEEARDPQEFALSIMDLAPKAWHGKLREFVMADTAVATIIEHAPELKDYPTWLADLVSELRAQFAPPDETPPDPQTPAA